MSRICDAVSLFVMQCIRKEKKQIQVSDLFSKECITFSFTLRALRADFCAKLSIYGEKKIIPMAVLISILILNNSS